MRTPLLCLASLLLLFSSGTRLLAQNKIVPAPDAVELRKVWEKKGRDLRVDEYGTAMWGGIDLSGDGIADFAVYQATGDHPNTWHFYRGGEVPDTSLLFRSPDFGGLPLVVGDFRGLNSPQIIGINTYRVVIDDYSWYYDRTELFEIHQGHLNNKPILSVYQGEQEVPIQRNFVGAEAIDINGDQIDDLALKFSSIRVGQNRFESDPRAQIWIYLGGPDFQLDSPSVVIYDTLLDGTTPGPDWSVELTDIDGDGHIDMLSNGGFPDYLTRFRWGDDESPISWTQRPVDRDLKRGDTTIALRARSATPHYQIDSDPGADFVGIIANPDKMATAYIFLSSQESPRTRRFTFEDADSIFLLPERFSYSEPTGYLNDNKKRVEMLPFERPEFFGDQGGLMFLSGGTSGPDADYDAYVSPSRRGWALGDVTGDGWDDYGASDPDDGVRATGIAIVYAGGPYIPLDDPTLNVREEPVAGEAGGLFLWPNPVVDELNIAWRGDLRQMPARFEVYDVRGVLVAEGEVEPGRGKALWMCGGVASGHYVIVGYDDSGAQIASAPVIVQ